MKRIPGGGESVIKNAKTIAEYAIRRWLEDEGFVMECFQLEISGYEGIVTDRTRESLRLVYDETSKTVKVVEER